MNLIEFICIHWMRHQLCLWALYFKWKTFSNIYLIYMLQGGKTWQRMFDSSLLLNYMYTSTT